MTQGGVRNRRVPCAGHRGVELEDQVVGAGNDLNADITDHNQPQEDDNLIHHRTQGVALERDERPRRLTYRRRATACGIHISRSHVTTSLFMSSRRNLSHS